MTAVARVSSPTARTVRMGCAQLFVLFAARRDSEASFGEFLVGSKLGGRNLIILRDPFEQNYERGLGEIVKDPFHLAAWLRKQRMLMPHVREVYTLGHSSGGYGALLFGHLIGADRAFSFSPRAARVDGAEEAKARLVERLAKHNGKTAFEICFSPLVEEDNAFAERLGACPGVKLSPRSEFGAIHGVMGELVANGELARMLPAFTPTYAP